MHISHQFRGREFAFWKWVWLPGFCILLLVVSGLLWQRFPVAADLTAILVCYVLCRACIDGVMSWELLRLGWVRWVLLLLGFCLSIWISVQVQKFLWPTTHPPHVNWFLPVILFGFQLVFILPHTISAEVTRKTQIALQEEEKRHKIERQLLEAKLAALQAQIEPHFLYNTLANVRALIRQDAAASEKMLTHLIAYLRAAMPDLRSPTTTLGQELERARSYLEIMQIRLGHRLQFRIDAAADSLDCLIPPLSLMTLVENAIQHGIETQLEGGTIAIDSHRDADRLEIVVRDTGPGLSSEMGEGVGLLNLQQRLHVMYDQKAQLKFESDKEKGLQVTILIPLQEKAEIKR